MATKCHFFSFFDLEDVKIKNPYISQSLITVIAEYFTKLNYWYFFTKIGWISFDKKVPSILIRFSNNEPNTSGGLQFSNFFKNCKIALFLFSFKL